MPRPLRSPVGPLPAQTRGALARGTVRAGALLLAAASASGGPRGVGGAYTDAKPLRFKPHFDPFKVLGLPKEQALPASDTLRKAFKQAALKWHPDRCRRTSPVEVCEARMEEVHLAQDVLSDERRLQQWEAWAEDQRSGGSAQPEGLGGSRRPRPRPAPRPAPPTPRPAEEARPWAVVSRQKHEGLGGAEVEVITRERELAGTPMIQVEVLEKTCYQAQVQCQETVLERRRRRKDEAVEL